MYMHYLELICMRDLPIHPQIYLYQCEFIDIYFILWVIIKYHLIYFIALSWLLCWFDKPLCVCSATTSSPYMFLTQNRIFSALESTIFPRSLVILLDNDTGNQNLDVGHAQFLLGLC